MWSLIFLLFINTSVAQIAAEGSNLTFLLAPAGNLSLATDPYSPFYPNDFYRNIQYLNSKIYTLGSNNIVQVYNKTNPTSMLQSFNEYSYAYGLPYAFIFLSVNPS